MQLLPVQQPDDLEEAFAAMTRERAEALLLVPSPFFGTHRARLVRLIAESRLPAIHTDTPFVHQGGLMAYGPQSGYAGRRAAIFVDKILKGAKPADLPVEQGVNSELVINLKTAQALGLTIPPALLLLADEVIR
jgi:putative ABC transport system substrate-binding protein